MKNKDEHERLKSKEFTKKRFLEAVGEIFMEEGISEIGINNVARRAGFDKKLIYRYFKSRTGLLDAYIEEKDYWLKFQKGILESINCEPDSRRYPVIVADILKNQLEYFFHDKEAQKIILAEISGDEQLLESVSRVREQLGEDIFAKLDPIFQRANIDFRALSSLLVAGIYYIVLHAIFNGTTFCGVDINRETERERVGKVIEWVIFLVFKAAKIG
ncbi:TetR/AcrR family transcriptional regulator [Desertivirga brevis]|uniref:TetR/AcrR family transcriptional regulator n=1 Tax=Desertivirga brevis TaxID=2810310 RepID=UPI001A95FE68|nr:TetR/AcrR family transcriptional regulator [Pedobacter sp. SYSU D00873]